MSRKGPLTLILILSLVFVTPMGTCQLHAQAETPSRGPPIRLQVATFDPLVGEPEIPAGLRLNTRADLPTTYLVQFTGPVRNEWKSAAEQSGARLYGYIPDHAFLARMNPDTVEGVQNLPFVRWIGPYHPAYRIAPTLTRIANEENTESIGIAVQTLPDTDLDAVAKQVKAWGGEVQRMASNDIAGYLQMGLPGDRLTALAHLDGVIWVESYIEPKLLNDVGGGEIMRADEIRTSLNLHGSGQVVGVADSGLDTGDEKTLHPDVQGRVVSAYALGRVDDWSDPGGHGTHVVGSVLGNGTVSGGTFAGTAPQAELVFQSLSDPMGGLGGIPYDRGELMRNACDDDARVHTNSWGGPTGGTTENPEYGGYPIPSQQVDWATWERKHMLVLFAAGNEGTDADSDGIVDFDSLGQPGTAKNVLTVGASENDRSSIASTWGQGWPNDFPANPIKDDRVADNPDGMAAFSSRGPTDDGRIKPDVVSPGTYVASMRTRQYLFDDDLEGDISGYSQASLGGGTTDWELRTDEPHSGTHHWQQIVTGTRAPGSTTALFTPPMNVAPAGSFDVHFWHRYALGGNDVLRMILLAPDFNNPGQMATTVYVLNLSGTEETYTRFRLVASASSLKGQGFDLTALSIGFEIYSPDATYSSAWSLDDIRVDGADDGALSSFGLAQPGDAVDEAYVMMGGTSMATPLTAGAAALAREWLTTIRGVDSPSGALMKAVLINGAADVSPGQYGTGATQEIPSLRPSNVSGWGRVDLMESLDPPDPRRIWLLDHSRGLYTGNSTVFSMTVGITETLTPDHGLDTSSRPLGTDQLLENPGFDTGAWAPWTVFTEIGSPGIARQVFRSAPCSARLGGNVDTHDYVSQQVTVPADATEATLECWYRVSGTDPDPEETLCFEILNLDVTEVLYGDGFLLSEVERQNEWLHFRAVISGPELEPLLGKTVLVSFSAFNNGTNPSTAWVDDTSFSVAVPGPLRITLAWSDYPGEPSADPALVNDLDLELIGPNGTHYYGNQGIYASGDACLRDERWDACNNIEGIIIPEAMSGTYTVTVQAYEVPQGRSQPFALVASGEYLQGPVPRDEPTTICLPVVVNEHDRSELLVNGDFDTGSWSPWQTFTEVGAPALVQEQSHSPPYSARLGGSVDTGDFVSQLVTVPADATELTLNYWDRTSAGDGDSYDHICIEIVNSAFDEVLTGNCFSLHDVQPQDQWVERNVVISGAELAPLLGQTVYLSFNVHNDDANPGTVWVDDVSLRVTGTGMGRAQAQGSRSLTVLASQDHRPAFGPHVDLINTYLPVILKSYDQRQLLANGDFDTGTSPPWQILTDVGSPGLSQQQYHSAPYAARMGGTISSSDYVNQEIAVPVSATEVTLDFWYRASGTDPDPGDNFCYEILDSELSEVLYGSCLFLNQVDPQNRWIQIHLVIRDVELAPLLGQTVYMSFNTHNSATNPSTAWVDDVSLMVTESGS